MSNFEKLFLAQTKLQLTISREKLYFCNKSTNAILNSQAKLLEIEVMALSKMVEAMEE